MEFCIICNNMLYITRSEKNNLVKYCRHCDYKKEEINPSSAIKVSQTIYTEDDLLYNQYVNKYLPLDPTLRRIDDPYIICPDEECITKTDSNTKQQVIYIKYHHENMKYLYCCNYCCKTWKQ